MTSSFYILVEFSGKGEIHAYTLGIETIDFMKANRCSIHARGVSYCVCDEVLALGQSTILRVSFVPASTRKIKVSACPAC